MTCKSCNDTESWHNWKQKPYCSPYCKGNFKGVTAVQGEWSRNAKMQIAEHIDDVQQPLRHDGTFNPHFVKVHGTKSIEKEFKVKREVIMSNVAKYG